jgi:hypothetical protein
MPCYTVRNTLAQFISCQKTFSGKSGRNSGQLAALIPLQRGMCCNEVVARSGYKPYQTVDSTVQCTPNQDTYIMNHTKPRTVH